MCTLHALLWGTKQAPLISIYYEKKATHYQNITLTDLKYCFIILGTLKWKMTKKVIVSEAQRRMGTNVVQLLYFTAYESWGIGHMPAHTSWLIASLLLLLQFRQCEQTWIASLLHGLIPKGHRVLIRYEFTYFALESIDYHIYKYVCKQAYIGSKRYLWNCAVPFPHWLLFHIIGGTSSNGKSHFQQVSQRLGIILILIIIQLPQKG